MSNEIEQTYGFTYIDYDGKEYAKTIKTPGGTWIECLNDYVRFLESIFQYDIMDNVRIEKPKWLDLMHETHPCYNDPWSGEYFVTEEEENEEDVEDELTDEYGFGDPK